MRRFFNSFSFKLFCVVLAALIVGAMFSALSHGGSSPLTSVAGAVFGPVQRLASFTSAKLSSLPFSFRSSTVLAEEIDTLEGEVGTLRDQLVDYEQLRRKLNLYEEFLELKEDNPDQQYCEASVVGRDSADYIGSFTLNKGANSGISVQDPVIYGSNLVGVVASVTPTQCTVNTILNPNVNVSCYEIRTGSLGYSTTTVALAQQGFCQMPNLPTTTAITEGGMVCTSGVGGVYPADLIIGTIDSIVDATVDISAAAIIKPAIELNKITAVFVVTEFEGQGSN